MGFEKKEVPEHGTRQRYIHRTNPCRCGACSEANTAYIREYRTRRKNNRNRPLTTKTNYITEGRNYRTEAKDMSFDPQDTRRR